MTRRHFVLDTNVLLHAPECLRQFAENIVVIPVDVIEELDNFKTRNDELGRNARSVIRIIDEARLDAKETLATGAPINDHGGTIRVDLKPVCLLEDGLRDDTPDNRIISVAYRLKREGHDVAIISKDVAMRVKSDALGIPAEDFESDKVPSLDNMFLGWRTVHCNGDAVVQLHEQGRATITLEDEACPNEAILLRDESNPKNTALARPVAGWTGGNEVELRPFLSSNQAVQGIAPRNLEQRVALELLLDPDVNLVTLVGKAGTGKTLLALVAGLYQTTKKHMYEKLLVSRPVMPLGRDNSASSPAPQKRSSCRGSSRSSTT